MPPGADVPAGCELWFVVQSRPRQELLAATAIEVRTHLDVFVPEVLEARQGRKVPKPLFPGYLFVRTDPALLPARTIN
ncbi:MAG: transcription termination/antitermination NusG family protein, partial [Caldilineaceae bacterium]|nr:transcription termination/antitermination NusG family protein [Caldilineaceae bacterium]